MRAAGTIPSFSGLLTGARSYRAIAQWARVQHAAIGPWLEFQRRPPCTNCFRNLLLTLAPNVLEASGPQESSAGVPARRRVEGKTLAAHERNIHLLNLFEQAIGGVLGQLAVAPMTNEAQPALDLLKSVILRVGTDGRDQL